VGWLLVGLGVVVVVVGAVLVTRAAGTPTTPSASATDAPLTASATAPDAAAPAEPDSSVQVPHDTQECSQDNPCADVPLPVAPGTQVEVLVTSSGWDANRKVAWVAGDIGVLDSSGTCTATLRRGQTTVVQAEPAEPGPATTSCAVEVDRGRLSAGEWLVSLSYVSSQHSGAAPDVSIKVP